MSENNNPNSNKNLKQTVTLQFFNTVTKQTEVFKPIDPEHIKMYVCGPTVYASPHIGNARPMIVFDVLFRLLKVLYPSVTYARNITDIDDKIITAAKEQEKTISQITTAAYEAFSADMKKLNVLPPTYEPKATEYIPNMTDIIKKLLHQNNAYVAENGDVLFDIGQYSDYGLFTPIDELESGHRRLNNTNNADISQDNKSESDKSPLDFVLWKNVADEDAQKYEYAWLTPDYMKPLNKKNEVMYGRPGWHIECTAMSISLLGAKFDIHGGGQDLIFPHHENERAQTCAYSHEHNCANYWMHNGLIQAEDGKMSKSLGNTIYLKDLHQQFPGESVRYFMLQTHYRHPLIWKKDNLSLAHIKLTKILKTLWLAKNNNKDIEFNNNTEINNNIQLNNNSTQIIPEIFQALANDLNTPLAITHLDQYINTREYKKAYAALQILGLFPNDDTAENVDGIVDSIQSNIQNWLQRMILTEDEKQLMEKRWKAKLEKDFQTADQIRKEFEEKGIVIEDNGEGYVWYNV